jgi:pyruvate dehydrogenase E2 component (dihydrolipoamide acetyltransferase)
MILREFNFPDIGEGIHEARIVKIFIKEGDFVKEHQSIAEVETDKAVSEIPSPFEGKVIKINFKEGDTIRVGDIFFVVETSKEFSKENGKEVVAKKDNEEIIKPAGAVGYLKESSSNDVLAAPFVRKLAKDLGIDLRKVKGTGPGGRITEKDIRNFVSGGNDVSVKNGVGLKKKRKYDFWGYVDYLPLNNIKRVTASHMTEAWLNAPQVTVMDMPDIQNLIKLREERIKIAEQKGVKLTYLPFIMKACYHAMIEYPLINSVFDKENNEVIVKKYYNFGVAVDVGDGLVVPVVKGVNMKDVFQIAKEISELATKARNKKLDLQDMRGGTFTITNYGSIGGLFATPIINFPEVAILGLGRITDNKLPLSLTFDHRVIDGAYAIRFLNLVISFLQNPKEF